MISYKSRMKFKEHFEILVDVAHFAHKKRTIQNEEISIEEIWREYANEYLINNEEYIEYPFRIYYIAFIRSSLENRIGSYCEKNNLSNKNYVLLYNDNIYQIIHKKNNGKDFSEFIWIGHKSKIDISSLYCLNFNDIFQYFKNTNINVNKEIIKKSIGELLDEGFSNEEIEKYINDILYKEKENPKQKVKTPKK